MSDTTITVRGLIEKGHTDLALKEFAKNISPVNKDVLSGLTARYVSYEREKMFGIADNKVELNSINYNLLKLIRLEEESDFEHNTNYEALVAELAALKAEMNKSKANPQHENAVKDIENAEEAAKTNDTPNVIKYLRSAGKWALDIAVKIGSSVATDAIDKALGIK